MSRPIKNNIINPAGIITPRRELNNNTMKREFVFPLVVGLILGVLAMFFWQFNSRLNNTANGLVELEKQSAQNTKTVGDIVTFINNATAPKGGAQAAPVAPAATNEK